MSLQDPLALALQALSVLNDNPPNPKQPLVDNGIHLRWFPGNDRDFPLTGGYYLFRRRVGGTPVPTCLMPLLKDRNPAEIASTSVLVTAIGTLVTSNAVRLQPVPIAPGKPGVLGFRIDREGIQFRLPAGVTASEFTVRLRFPVVAAKSVSTGPFRSLLRTIARTVARFSPEGQVIASLGPAVVFSQNIIRPAPPNQDRTISAHPTKPVDTIRIWAQSAVLLDLCYVPASSGGDASPVPVSAPISAPAPVATPRLPGRGWEVIPNLTSVIKMPLFHPQFPASPGSESLEASMAIAKSRMHYGAWADSFSAATPSPGTGTITLTNGSPMVTGSGTNWTDELVGKLIYLPSGSGGTDPTQRVTVVGTDHTAYAVMVVLAPDRLVMGRSYSGPSHNNAPYQLLVDDDFAELHDRVASLLQSPNDMRAAIVPPPLDRGTVAEGKCVMVFAGGQATQVNGIGTQWTSSLAGCRIEIGPSWFQSTYLAGRNIYRIQAVSSASQLTLDRPFAGLPHLAVFAKCDYRIFARSAGDDPDSPSFDFKPMDLLELASLMPSYAQALGLYWIDKAVKGKEVFDYIVIADRGNRFSQQVGKALDWLNGNPDFTGDAVDGFVKLGVKHLGSPPLAAPSQLELFRLPTGGARVSIAHPDRADSDAGVSVQNAASWADPNAPQPMPVMLNLSRLFRGTDAANLAPVGNDATGYDDLGRLLPSRRDPAKTPNPPAGWPTDPIHFVDSGPDQTGLDVGWYSYRAFAIDLYGRFSPDTQPLPWRDIDKTSAPVTDAIHLADTTPPPPPAGVLAWMLDDRDPYVLRDTAFQQWRNQFPASSPIVGLRLKFRWPWAHQNQGPDLSEFRVYSLDNPINARTGRVTSVSAVSGQPAWSLVTLDLDSPENTAANDYQGASLQAGDRAFAILFSASTTANQATSVQLTVENGGPSKTVMPESNLDGAIVIPSGHALHKELLHPGYWKWLAAIPQNLAGTRYDIDMVEDTAAIPFDADGNSFTGAQATWNGAAFVLDAIPGSHQLTSVRPGIDVLALSSDEPPGYYVMDIQSVQASGLLVVPKQLPDPVPLPATTFAWRIGPANAGLRGLAGSWNAASRGFSLDGTPNLSNVMPGADLIYIAAAGATPANLDFFFAIESVDGASRTLTLENTVHLNALPDGASFAWQIGRPVRHYEMFLPDPSVPQVEVTTDPSIELAPIFNLLTPSLQEPVRHGTIGVSSVDKRTEVADRYWPLRGRTGNESFISGPAPVFRVLRDPPPAPTYTWNVTRLLATRANYRDESFFTMRWDYPGAGYHAHVFRAMDSSLFLAHWNLSGALAVAGAPPGIAVLSGSSVLPGFDARKASFAAHSAAAAAAEASSDTATFEAESALAQIDYREAAKLYDQLDDETLSWLAARPELVEAYMQVTIKPLDLSDPAYADRLGPDNDPTTFTASPTVRAYVDTLPGKSTNKYFYAVMLLDGAQNRSALGGPSPPVYLPKVVPPTKPVITKVSGDELQITIQWARNREPDLAEYRIYRADDLEQARDIRSMQRVATVLPSAVDTTKPSVGWADSGNLIGGRKYFYRLSAVDAAGNESIATEPRAGIAVDTRVPEPPLWTERTWLLHREIDDTFIDWPANGIVPTGHKPVLRLSWQCQTPEPQFMVRRWADEKRLWMQPNNIEIRPSSANAFSFNLLDYDVDPALPNSYRLRVRSSSGVWSTEDAVVIADLPGFPPP